MTNHRQQRINKLMPKHQQVDVYLNKADKKHMIGYDMTPRQAFHITPSSNVDSILAQGLQPAKEKLADIPDNLCEVGVFMFPDRQTIEDATWFFDRFDDDVALTVFAVDIEGIDTFSNHDVGYEIWSRTPIPPERLTVVEVM